MKDEATFVMYETLSLIKQYAPEIEKLAGVEEGTIRKCITELTAQKNNYRKKYIRADEFNRIMDNSYVKQQIGDHIIRGFDTQEWENFCKRYVISVLNQAAFAFVRPGEPDTPCPQIYMDSYKHGLTESLEEKDWKSTHPDNGAVLRWMEEERVYWAERKKEQKEERERPEKEKKWISEKEKEREKKRDKLRETMKRRFESDSNDMDARLWLEADMRLQEHEKEMKK